MSTKHIAALADESSGFIAHSTLNGAAIGAASLVNFRVGIVVALAVIAHDMSDGLNTMMLVTRGEKPRTDRFVCFSEQMQLLR